MAWTHIQSATPFFNNTGPTSQNIVLPVNPTPGNLVVAAILLPTGFTVTAADSAANAYTVTPNSSSTLAHWLFYLLTAPGSATKTITFTISAGGSAFLVVWADEFHLSSGTMAFDKDAFALNATGSGTTANQPSIVPSGAGELLYGVGSPNDIYTAPTSGNTLGVWTGAGLEASTGSATEYDLSASASTAAQYTLRTSGDTYSNIIAAFGLASAFVAEDDSFNVNRAQIFDPTVTVWQ